MFELRQGTGLARPLVVYVSSKGSLEYEQENQVFGTVFNRDTHSDSSRKTKQVVATIQGSVT